MLPIGPASLHKNKQRRTNGYELQQKYEEGMLFLTQM